MNGSSSFGTGNFYSTYNYTLCGVPGVFGTLGTPAAGNTPGGSQYASAWTDSSGNFWLFGGYGTEAAKALKHGQTAAAISGYLEGMPSMPMTPTGSSMTYGSSTLQPTNGPGWAEAAR
jgi:hypothetical protein